MDIVIKFWGYLTDAGTAVPAITGIVLGIAIGSFISRGMWDFISECRRFRREDRLRKDQEEQKRKEKESQRAFYKECAERGIVYSDEHSAYLSADKTLFCPACYRMDKLSELVFNTESEILYCTECGEKIERKQNKSSYFYR